MKSCVHNEGLLYLRRGVEVEEGRVGALLQPVVGGVRVVMLLDHVEGVSVAALVGLVVRALVDHVPMDEDAGT